MKHITFALLSLLFSLSVQAEEVLLYERPAFMADSMPLKIECRDTRPLVLTCFEKYELPAMVPAKVVNADGSGLRVVQVPTTYIASCGQGMCVSQRDQTPVGDVDFPQLKGKGFIAQTFEGYYLAKDEKNHLVAYKRGFGPLADKYPPFRLYTEPVQRMSTNTDPNTFDVWCSPQSDTCDFNGKQVSRQELSKLIPKKSTEWCDMEFCYATEYFDGVVGINPAGSL